MARTGLAALAAVLVVAGTPPPADAVPPPKPAGEHGSPLLRDVLERVGRDWLTAKAQAESSRRRQAQLHAQVAAAQKRHDALLPRVTSVAASSYRIGPLGLASSVLNSGPGDAFLRRVTRLSELTNRHDKTLHDLNQALADLQRTRQALDTEAQQEQVLLARMTKQKQEAEKALALVGGQQLTQGLVAATSPVAKAAPRSADGSFALEPCSRPDPTTGGCLTARTLHAYRQVRAAGFRRFVGCYRPGGPFEHPKGRACDWSLLVHGFRPATTAAEKMYGNNLTAFLVRNADRLGILYVIWYRRIWFPATGWNSYSGDSDHTDHVHMSML